MSESIAIEPVISAAVHATHIMGVDFSIDDNRFCELCTVCFACSFHSEESLKTPCAGTPLMFENEESDTDG